MNIEIQPKNTKMLVDFHRYDLPSGPPPVEFLHQHNFTEIHIISQGKLTIISENCQYEIPQNSAVIIPPNFYHSVSTDNNEAKWFAFTSTTPCQKLACKEFGAEFLESFFSKLDTNQDGNNSASIINYIFFICNELTSAEIYEKIPSRDYMEEIHNFICVNYAKDVHVSDVAKTLHISDKHIQRIIKNSMGFSFGELVLHQRMKVADSLIKQNRLSLQEIAAIVGYTSYSGFWKAYNKYKSEEKISK